MKRFIFCLFSLFAVSVSSLFAQETNEGDQSNNSRFWEANLKGGEYMVLLGRISSVSHHEYMIEGGIVVTEVVIDTQGKSLARFYYLGTAAEKSKTGLGGAAGRVRDLVDDAGERTTGQSASSVVTKQYPLTTHAHTVEYRLRSRQALLRLYGSVKKAWKDNRGRTFTDR